MKERVKNFFEDLDKDAFRDWPLQEADEEMAAILVANIFVDNGIPPGEVLRCLKVAGVGDDPKLLAVFRDKDRREELLAALQRL